MTLRIEVITDTSRFLAIEDAWKQLWQRSGSSIFQQHVWIAGWLTAVQDRRDSKLHISLVWDGDRLCGAWPCAVQRRSRLRVLTWAAQPVSDYCDCLLDTAYGTEKVLSMLWDGLYQFGGFDLINFQQVRPDAKCRLFLDQLTQDGNQLQVGERSERCMRIENLWANGDAFFRSLNKKGRNNHTRGKRILSELGGDVRLRCVEPPEDPRALFEEIIRLKLIWLRANDPGSALLGSDVQILRSALDSAWRSGLSKIFLLESGDKLAAASVNFVYSGRMEAYFTSYDAAFDRASPGTILIVEYAQWSFDRGLSYVDFLRGEEAFKFRLANGETVISSFSGARTFVGQLVVSGHRWLARRRHRPKPVVGSTSDGLEAVA